MKSSDYFNSAKWLPLLKLNQALMSRIVGSLEYNRELAYCIIGLA